MGTTEIIDERRESPKVFSADYRRVMSGAVQKAMDQADTPMDSGWGYKVGEAPAESSIPPAVSDAASKIVGVTYAGEIPTPPAKVPEGFKPFPTLP